MEPYNFKEKIRTYIKTNPFLSHGDLGVLLLIDNIYQELPDDISELRKINTYFDPKHINLNDIDQLTFLKIIKLSDDSKEDIKEKLRKYLDMKYSCRGYDHSYEQNMNRFKEDSAIAQKFLEEILEIANLPEEITKVLSESKEINRKNLFELLTVFKETKSKKIKYEILRKLAIIDILTRVRKNFQIRDLDYASLEILKVFAKGLKLAKTKPVPHYFWIDEKEKVQSTKSKREAELNHIQASLLREKSALGYFPIQRFNGKPALTGKKNRILYMEVRNKLRKDGELYYTSTVEKIIRKNLEFPTQIHDTIGIRIVVENQDDILDLISELESFIGGASLRKKEKNSTSNAKHKFGKKQISKYSAKEYYVWKAVYDIALRSSFTSDLKRFLNLATKGEMKEKIKQELSYYMERPVNYIVEVQIQDLESYLLSIAKGSPADHSKLKMKQIRNNSFYKIFPKEIYEKELLNFRNTILQENK